MSIASSSNSGGGFGESCPFRTHDAVLGITYAALAIAALLSAVSMSVRSYAESRVLRAGRDREHRHPQQRRAVHPPPEGNNRDGPPHLYSQVPSGASSSASPSRTNTEHEHPSERSLPQDEIPIIEPSAQSSMHSREVSQSGSIPRIDSVDRMSEESRRFYISEIAPENSTALANCCPTLRNQSFKFAFLICVLGISLIRSFSFLDMVLRNQSCSDFRGVIKLSMLSEQIMTTLPCAIFITGFSFFLYNLSSIYHLSLNYGIVEHENYFTCSWSILVLLNLGSYVSLCATYMYWTNSSWQSSTETVLEKSFIYTASCFVAFSFICEGCIAALYGFNLYTTFAQQSSRSNPLFNIAVVCGICQITFLVRAVIILTNLDQAISVAWSGFYYGLTELFPIVSVMVTLTKRRRPPYRGGERAPLLNPRDRSPT